MKEQFEFTYNNKKYAIDNTAYGRVEKRVLFEVKTCPKCRKINRYDIDNCSFCGTPISSKKIVIASWNKRWGLSVVLTAVLWGLVTGGLFGFKLRLGAIPAMIVYAVCMMIAGAICGKKIYIETAATDDYWAYRKQCAEQTTNIKLTDLKMTKVCKECNSRLEEDSRYCSNCGKWL